MKQKQKQKPKANRTAQQTVKQAVRSLTAEEATSPDTMLLAGGLALFVLVLADMVFLTLSTRVLRVR